MEAQQTPRIKMDTAHDSRLTPSSHALPAGLPLRKGRRVDRPTPREWTLDYLGGRLVELSSSGTTPSLTAAASLILQAQQRSDPVTWITIGDSTFFPPDLVDWGIDLEALPVLRVASGIAAARAADHLLRSGAFGLVVLDLKNRVNMRMAVQSRLAALAKRHHTLLLCLTRKGKEDPSLGSLVSLHGRGRRERTSFNRFNWKIHVIKDKQGAPGWQHAEFCRGADGLC